MSLADFITMQAASVSLGDLSGMFVSKEKSCPIDRYKERIKDILRYGNPERLTDDRMIGRLLAVNTVSVVEAYLRSIISSVMEICPISQSIASEKTINLGGMLWHGRYGYSLSAFDHVSFSNAEDIQKISRSYIGFELQKDKFAIPLAEFDRVCHIRHGIVHNDGILPGRNAVKLGISRSSGALETVVDFKILQEIAAVANALVTTYNRELFVFMCKRWGVDWRSRADWLPENEDYLFNRLWDMFSSRVELALRHDRTNARRIDCLRAVKRHFDLD